MSTIIGTFPDAFVQSSRGTRVRSFMLVLLGGLCGSIGLFGQTTNRQASLEMRNQILQRAFGSPPARQLGILVCVVRMLPSSHPEVEIHLRFSRPEEPVQVEYLRARKQLDTLWTGTLSPTPNPGIIAQQMQIQRQLIEIPVALGRKWIEELHIAFSESSAAFLERSQRVQLDGTKYVLIVQGELVNIDIAILGSEFGHVVANDAPLVRWMDGIRRDLEALLK
jgi:hypothetical protein